MYLKNKVDKAIKVIATSENVKKFDSISNRFWKLGKRYGKKNFESQQLSGVIAAAVMASGERISEEFLLELQLKGGKLKSLQERVRFISEKSSDFPTTEPSEEDDPTEIKDWKPLATSLGVARRNDLKALDNAADALQRHRESETIRINREKFDQRISSKKAVRDGYLNDLQALKEQVIVLQSEYEEIPNIFMRKYEVQKNMGLICWARFADGYQIGRSSIRRPGGITKKRRARSQQRYDSKTSKTAPNSGLEIPTPHVLKSAK
jgi:hypothetical protein